MLTAIPIADETWPFFERRLNIIRSRCHTDWVPEDVRRDCLARKAFLYGTTSDRTFAVVVPQVNRFTGETELFVWAGWVDKISRGEQLDLLFEIAKGVGATRLKMSSPRRGYDRIGWEPQEVVYTREVPGQ